MYVWLFVLNLIFLMTIAFVLFLRIFTLLVVFLFSVSCLSSVHSTSSCFLPAWLVSYNSIFSIKFPFYYNCEFLLILFHSSRIGPEQTLIVTLAVVVLYGEMDAARVRW